MKYRKKPVVIDAIVWDGENREEIEAFCTDYMWVSGALYVDTLEGTHCARVGDYIIKGVQGEFYPCKPDIFEQTYEPVEEWHH